MARGNFNKYISHINQQGMLIFSEDLERPPDRFKQWDIHRLIAQDYEEAVNEAIENDSAFQNFKRNAKYTSIVGMCNDFQSRIWLERIEEEFPEILSKIEQFKKNDTIGNPSLWHSGKYGMISPDTLHRINTLCDIEKYFGGLKKKM